MRTVSTNDFRDNLAEYLTSVAKNDTPLLVKRFGKPIVKIIAYKKKKTSDYKKFYGFLGEGESGEEFVNRVRRSKKEREYVKHLRNR